MTKNELIYSRWVDELWNKGEIDSIDELFADDGIAYYPYFLAGREPIRGAVNFKRFVKAARESFANIRAEVIEIACEPDHLIALTEISGNPVRDGEVSTERMSVKGLSRVVFEGDKIVEIWNNLDIADTGERKRLFDFENK